MRTAINGSSCLTYDKGQHCFSIKIPPSLNPNSGVIRFAALHAVTTMPDQKKASLQALIVEDNRDLARLFSDLLEVLGCKADVEWNAKSGLEKATELQPDIIFCDISMPGEKNGLDVAREVRATPALAHTWLIAVTGYDNEETCENALAAGFDRVFAKPVKFAQMQAVLDDVRNMPRRAAPPTAKV
jgi:CheY-like chemotaxis protein